MTAAARMRRSRARRREGRRVYRIVVDETLLEDALRLHLHLAPTADDPKETERALNDMIAQFCAVARNGVRERNGAE